MSTENSSIPISLNGEIHHIAPGETILDLLARLEIEPSRVAVELDRRIVKQADWASTALPEGARVEVVQFVGGG
ncbi:MAG: sulfur carrier protein ThiS [Bryobacteraceae bacterium]